MPELPEVETIRRQLAKSIVGESIVNIEVRRASCYEGGIERLPEKIISVEREGKYLFVRFESGNGMIIHLKMTGRLVVEQKHKNIEYRGLDYDKAPHTRVVMSLADGRQIFYWDARTFGYVKYVKEIENRQIAQRAKLGPDPWQMDESNFYKLCQKYARPIKNLILDQALLSGVGNIYANDGLWKAGINPSRTAKSLKRKETAKLLRSLREVMERGLVTGGASDNSYVDALGRKGRYQDEFLTYKRTGQPCFNCETPLVRIVVGGRGSWVCKKCQR